LPLREGIAHGRHDARVQGSHGGSSAWHNLSDDARNLR